MANNKIQSEFLNEENNIIYWEQYFTSQTFKKLEPQDYLIIRNFIEDAASLMSLGNKLQIEIKIKNE
jgi:hypothetical protein